MWKIDGANELVNKADVWKSNYKWKFRNVTKTKVYVENISKTFQKNILQNVPKNFKNFHEIS